MELKVNTRYTRSDEYDYETKLVRLNLDKEKNEDVLLGDGFIIKAPKAIKDDLKDPEGIFSEKFGPGLNDVNAFGNRYRCKCGATTQRFYHGLKCPICGEKVEFKDNLKKELTEEILDDIKKKSETKIINQVKNDVIKTIKEESINELKDTFVNEVKLDVLKYKIDVKL